MLFEANAVPNLAPLVIAVFALLRAESKYSTLLEPTFLLLVYELIHLFCIAEDSIC